MAISPHIPTKFSWFDKLYVNFILSGYEKNIINEIVFLIKHRKEIDSRTGFPELAFIIKSLQGIENIDGEVIELGTYYGGTTLMLSRILNQMNSNKKIFACDTFNGFPYKDKFVPKALVSEFDDEINISQLQNKFKKFNVADRIVIIKGKFEDTLYQKLNDKKFSFAFIDCDLYDSGKFALDFVYPRIVKNGIIIIHDYAKPDWGIGVCVDKFAYDHDIKLLLEPLCHLIKHTEHTQQNNRNVEN